MSKLLIQQLSIPRRMRSCCKSGKLFAPGDDIVSILKESKKEGVFTREDILLEVWDKAVSLETVHWFSKIPEKSEQPVTSDEFLERAFSLMMEYLAKEGEDFLLKAFLLALFLTRKKRLLFRQEMVQNDHPTYLLEVAETGEMLSFTVMDIPLEKLTTLQQELTNEIGSLS